MRHGIDHSLFTRWLTTRIGKTCNRPLQESVWQGTDYSLFVRRLTTRIGETWNRPLAVDKTTDYKNRWDLKQTVCCWQDDWLQESVRHGTDHSHSSKRTFFCVCEWKLLEVFAVTALGAPCFQTESKQFKIAGAGERWLGFVVRSYLYAFRQRDVRQKCVHVLRREDAPNVSGHSSLIGLTREKKTLHFFFF